MAKVDFSQLEMPKEMPGQIKSPKDPEYNDIRHTRYVPPEEHFETTIKENAQAMADPKSSRRTMVMMMRALKGKMPDGVPEIDFEKELAGFKELPYPEYYLQPFHSVPGGWLSKRASTNNRRFMQAIYKDVHVHSCMGLRADLSKLVPPGSRHVVDLGCGDGDGPASTARELPRATVLGIDASPFMLIVGRTQNPGLPNLHLEHGLAEATGLPDGCTDCVTITLLFHECNNVAKVAIAQEAKRILRPGGTIVFADTPQDDLHTYRGAFEPYKDEWKHFEPARFFQWLGFVDFCDHGLLGGNGAAISEEEQRNLTGDRTDNRLFVCTAKKPEPTLGSKL